MEAKNTRMMKGEVTFCSKDMDEQAEITWKVAKDEDIEIIRDSFNRGYKKGKQAGMKELVEWINKEAKESEIGNVYYILKPIWQAKLKEWEI